MNTYSTYGVEKIDADEKLGEIISKKIAQY